MAKRAEMTMTMIQWMGWANSLPPARRVRTICALAITPAATGNEKRTRLMTQPGDKTVQGPAVEDAQGQPAQGIQQGKDDGEEEKAQAEDGSRAGVGGQRVPPCGRAGPRSFHPPDAQPERQQDEEDGEQVEPQGEKQHEGEIFVELPPVDDFHEDERQDAEQTDEGR